jgi:hypothetical protein
VIADLGQDPPEWVLTDGALDFSFKASRLARFKSAHSYGSRTETVLWSELKHPLDKPIGKTRRRNVQPDYSVVAHPSDNAPVGLVVECKQYWKPAAGNFRAALIDYARAHLDAMIVLANYGATPASIAKDLGLDDPGQPVMAFGDVHPLGAGLADFRAAVTKGLQHTGVLAKRTHDRTQAAARFSTPAQREAAKAKARIHTFQSQAAEVVIKLCWDTGGDLDLWAVAYLGGEVLDTVNFETMGDLRWPPYAMLDHDARAAPGQETIKLGVWFHDWLIEVRRHQGSWPQDVVRVEVTIGRRTEVYERRLQASDGDRWLVCVISAASKSALELNRLEALSPPG